MICRQKAQSCERDKRIGCKTTNAMVCISVQGIYKFIFRLQARVRAWISYIYLRRCSKVEPLPLRSISIFSARLACLSLCSHYGTSHSVRIVVYCRKRKPPVINVFLLNNSNHCKQILQSLVLYIGVLAEEGSLFSREYEDGGVPKFLWHRVGSTAHCRYHWSGWSGFNRTTSFRAAVKQLLREVSSISKLVNTVIQIHLPIYVTIEGMIL